MLIEFYEVFEDGSSYDVNDTVYGRFSSYEKAKELSDKLIAIDGCGVSGDDILIRKIEIEPDRIENWVMDLIEQGRKWKLEIEEEEP